MKPELILMRAMCVPAMVELEREFVVHKSWTAAAPGQFVKEACARAHAD